MDNEHIITIKALRDGRIENRTWHYSNTGLAGDFVQKLYTMQAAAEKWGNDLRKAIQDVAEERHRKELQAASLGQSIAAGFGQFSANGGFGQYPVNEGFIQHPQSNDTVSADIENVKMLVNARQWQNALDKLQTMNLANVDVKMCRVYTEFMSGLFREYISADKLPGRYDSSKKDRLLNLFQRKAEYMESKKSSSYSEYRDAVSDAVDKIEADTARFIEKADNNIFLFNGYYANDDTESAFFMNGRKLMYLTDNFYYQVKKIREDSITMVFDSYRIFHKKLSYGALFLRIKAVDQYTHQIVFSDSETHREPRVFYKRDTEMLATEYNDIQKARSSRFTCSKCGGAYSLWNGCSNQCLPAMPTNL